MRRRRNTGKKKPFIESKRYGYEVYLTWRPPFVRIVRFSIWGHFGPNGCYIRSR